MRNILLLLLLFTSSQLAAQFNSKVGYTGSILSLDAVDNLFTAFDDNTTYLDDKLGSISAVHGLELGALYRAGNLSFELGVTTGTGKVEAVGINPNTNEKDDFRWKVSTFDYHFGITQHFSNFGISGSINRQRVKVREFNSVAKEFFDITREYQWGVKISAQVQFSGAYTSFVIRPFYAFSLGDYNFEDVKQELAPDFTGSTLSPSKMFGISVLFFNGNQN